MSSLSSTSTEYPVVWPRGRRQQELEDPASRLPDLNGKTIGFVWNFVFRGEEIFPLLQKEIEQRYPGARFVGPEAFGNTHGSDEREVLEALPDRLKAFGVDAVISGNGC